MGTRITQNAMSYNYLRNLNKSLTKQDQLNKQLSDGKLIHKPSDDPIGTIRSMTFGSNLAKNEQYQQNLGDAQSWMNTTDGVMSQYSDIMIRIKELTLSAANGDKPQDAVQVIGDEVDNLLNQMVALGNTKIADRYVFAGQKDKTQPFVRDDKTGEVSYLGDNNKISMVINTDASAKAAQDSINLTGPEVFGGDGTQLMNQLNEIKNRLKSGTKEDQDWLSQVGLGYIEEGHNNILQSHTELGTRMTTYTMMESVLEENNTTISTDLSANEDADMAKLIMNFKVSEAGYKAALSVGSQVLPLSLVDFLK